MIYHAFQVSEPGFHFKDSIQKVIDLDPDYADAYAVRALFSLTTVSFADHMSAGFELEDAFDYNRKALELDPENESAILNQAVIDQWLNWNYITTEASFQKAFSIAPNTRHVYLISGYIEFLIKMERFEEALSYVKLLDTGHYRELLIYTSLDQPEYARETMQRYIRLGDPISLFHVGECCIWMENYEEAKTYLDTVFQTQDLSLHNSKWLAAFALTDYKTGDFSNLQAIKKELISRSITSEYGIPEYYLGWYFSGIGEIDSAFVWLEKAFDERSSEMSWIRADPVLDTLKDDSRYRDLYRRTGHEAYDNYLKSR